MHRQQRVCLRHPALWHFLFLQHRPLDVNVVYILRSLPGLKPARGVIFFAKNAPPPPTDYTLSCVIFDQCIVAVALVGLIRGSLIPC